MTYQELQEAFGDGPSIFSAGDQKTGINWKADWDSDEFADADAPSRVIAEGKFMLLYGGVSSADFALRDGEGWVTNPTWGDLMRFLDLVIEKTGDYHHVFLEGFTLRGGVLEIFTGS